MPFYSKLFLAALMTFAGPFSAGSRIEAEQALHCIVSSDQDWLAEPAKHAANLNVAFTHDKQSYPGEDHIILVVLQSAREGQVFDLQLQHGTASDMYTIQNNGRFIDNKRKITFIDPPLGGTWIQEYLAHNIRRAIANIHYSIPRGQLLRKRPDTTCSSYVEQKR